ncbi:MAG: matrixin family metalloprotease [Nanoarchaeota archaeon]
MDNKIYIVIMVTVLLLCTGVSANPQFLIPKNAVKISDNLYSLGSAFDKDGKKVDGLMFVHKRMDAKPGTGGGSTGSSSCYLPLARGTKWKTTESYILDPTNNNGINNTIISESVQKSMDAWDTQTSYDVFGNRDFSQVVDGVDTAGPDGKNEVLFGISDPNVIAVTTVWGIFSGPTNQRQIVEYDLLFNDDFAFGNAGPTSETSLGNTSLMDLEAIGTHELGHALGLGHPGSTCTEETMYAYASFGETKKRTLNNGDKAGLKSIYG